MPTCQAYKGTNTTGKTTKGKNFFKTPELKNATKRKTAQQWRHLIEEHLLDSICWTLCSYSHKTCSSYRYIVLPSIIFFGALLFRNTSFFSFILSISSCEYQKPLLQQPRIDSLSDSEVASNWHSLIPAESLLPLDVIAVQNSS